jgi:hypothetical protein
MRRRVVRQQHDRAAAQIGIVGTQHRLVGRFEVILDREQRTQLEEAVIEAGVGIAEIDRADRVDVAGAVYRGRAAAVPEGTAGAVRRAVKYARLRQVSLVEGKHPAV